MKNKRIKGLSILLGLTLTAGSVGGAAFAQTGKQEPVLNEPAVLREETPVAAQAGTSKNETVYVLADTDGGVQKIIVSDWLRNVSGAEELKDVSALTDIVNVKGDEVYTAGKDSSKVWNAKGKDIYYQGNTEKELPISLSLRYTLDGEPISAGELRGKSGKVTIRFDYTNNQDETVQIDGKKEKFYVPFAVLSGVLLDNDVFRNIEVTNGKSLNDGTRTAVVGIAFPGLQENLGVDRDKFAIPDYVEITADVQDFSLGMTVTVATNEIFNQLDLDRVSDTGELTGKLEELTDAMGQLTDGSAALYDGLCTLLDQSQTLVAGVDILATGTSDLKNGATTLDNGAAQLQTGTARLSDGLNAIASNNDALNGGAKQVFETLLSTAATQIAAAGIEVPAMTVDNYAQVLEGVIASLDDAQVQALALKTVTEAVEARRDYIKEQVTAAVLAEVTPKVTAAVRSEVESQVTAAVKAEVTAAVTAAVRANVDEQVISSATGMDAQTYATAVSANLVDAKTQAAITAAQEAQMKTKTVTALIESTVSSRMATDEVQALIAQNTAQQMESEDVKRAISDHTTAQMQTQEITAIIAQNTEAQVNKAITDAMNSEEVRAKKNAATEGRNQLTALKASLDSYNSFYRGLQTYTAGVSEAATGATTLRSGMDELKNGTARLAAGSETLDAGMGTLKNSLPALIDGITQLRDGSQKLSEGLKEFNEQGVQKLVDAVNGDLAGLLARIHATVNVSENYRNFSGIAEGETGNVKFIFRTDDIE